MQQFATGPHLLERKQIIVFVVNARQAITNELFGDVGQPVALALLVLFCRECLPLAYVVEYVSGAIGNPSVQFAVFVVVVSSTHAVGSVFGYPNQLQRFAVIERRVATAMVDAYGMFL